MSEPAPLDDPLTASRYGRFPCDLVQEVVRGVEGLGSDATPTDVGDEVRKRLDRIQRAWNAVSDCALTGPGGRLLRCRPGEDAAGLDADDPQQAVMGGDCERLAEASTTSGSAGRATPATNTAGGTSGILTQGRRTR
jgi:hypothetical protein